MLHESDDGKSLDDDDYGSHGRMDPVKDLEPFDPSSLETLVAQDDRPASDDSLELSPKEQKRVDRKAAKKRAKAERRARREGRADSSVGQKDCDVCGASVDLLIRCQIDASGSWKMVCGKCWKKVSGGVVDGDADHPHYRYGGLWKNRTRQTK